jgi:hypothetical protein
VTVRRVALRVPSDEPLYEALEAAYDRLHDFWDVVTRVTPPASKEQIESFDRAERLAIEAWKEFNATAVKVVGVRLD